MKNSLIIVCAIFFLYACTKKESDPSPTSSFTTKTLQSQIGKGYFTSQQVGSSYADTNYTLLNDTTTMGYGSINPKYINSYKGIRNYYTDIKRSPYENIGISLYVKDAPLGVNVFQDKQYSISEKDVYFSSDTAATISMKVSVYQIESGQKINLKIYEGTNDTVFVTANFTYLKGYSYYYGLNKYLLSGNFISFYIKNH